MGIYVGNKRYAPYIGDKRRRYMGGGSSSPYDAEVEYLEYDGYEYIDTGITPNETIEFEMAYMPTNTRAESAGMLSARSYTQSGGTTSNYSISFWANGARVAFNDKEYDSGWKSGITSYDIIKYISVKQRSLYVNDTLIASSGKTSTFSFDVTYGLLRGHYINDTWDNRRGSSGKLYYCKIWKDGSLVRDFIPVRVGTTGYMYDNVSGQLFGNRGTASFIVGPDKT